MNNNKTEFLNYFYIVTGSFFLAFGLVGFLAKNNIATGGMAGLAIVLHHIVNLPIGFLLAAINIPLLIIGLKYLGKRFAIKTIVCILITGISIDILDKLLHLPNLSSNFLLATLYGGVAIGIGLGLIFKGGASAGGGTIVAKIIASRTEIKTSSIVLVLDAFVVCFAGVVFKSIEISLWSLISIYVAAKLIDMVLVGAQDHKIVHISSSKNLTELSQIIAENFGISGTIVNGNNLEITGHRDIIFIVIDKSRLNLLKQVVSKYDNHVKMIVMEATEILGKEENRITYLR